MERIIVDPSRLESTASNVDSANSDYQRIYHNLYAEVDKMEAVWQGKDNTAFTNKIKAFEDDFRQISNILSHYSDFLRNSARAYRETQDELYNATSRLKWRSNYG